MKIYDFDEKFFEYARAWMALHPGLREDQVEEKYNEMMIGFLNAPAQWLGGEKPGMYFNRYSDPKDLLKLMDEYQKRQMGLPEPLYSRIVAVGSPCVPGLLRIAEDRDRPEAMRATAMALLRDIDAPVPVEFYLRMVAASREANELSEMAADVLKECDDSIVPLLMEAYDGASEYGQKLMLDICANHRGDPRVMARIAHKLMTCAGERDCYAALLEHMGDPEGIAPLKEALKLTELDYLEYIAIRNAIEALGGDPGEERDFNGDPSYEALRNM